MKKNFIIIVISLMSFVVMFFAVCLFANSEKGTLLALAYITDQLGEEIKIASIEGHLLDAMQFKNISYQQKKVTVQIDSLHIVWNPWKLFFGQIEASQLIVNKVNILLPEQDKNSDNHFQLPNIKLPFDVAVQSLIVNNVSVNHLSNKQPINESENSQLFEINKLELQAWLKDDGLTIESLELKLPSLAMSMSGTIVPFDLYETNLKTSWSAKINDKTKIEGAGTITGNLNELIIEHQTADFASTTLIARIKQPFSGITGQADVKINAIDLQNINTEWPVGNYSGTLSVFYQSGEWQIKKLAIANNDGQKLAEIEGKLIKKSNGEYWLNAEGNWQDLKWPLFLESKSDTVNMTVPLIESPEGNFTLVGSLNDYQLKLNAKTVGKNLPTGSWVVHGQGSQSHFELNTASLKFPEGDLLAKGRIDWTNYLQWTLNIAGQDIRPHAFIKAIKITDGSNRIDKKAIYKDKVNFNLGIEGNIQDSKLYGQVRIDDLNGLINGQPLKGGGSFHVKDEIFSLNQLEINIGSAKAVIYGQLTKNWNLHWKLEVPTLEHVMVKSTGSVHAQGQILGQKESPHIQLSMQGKAISVEAIKLGSIKTSIDFGYNEDKKSTIDVNLDNVVINDFDIDHVVLKGIGSVRKHEFSIAVESPLGTLKSLIKGDYSNNKWFGKIASIDITRSQYGQWQLAQPDNIELVLADKNMEIVSMIGEELCLKNAKALICTTARWQASTGVSVSARVADLPLDLVNQHLESGMKIHGRVNGEFDFNSPISVQQNEYYNWAANARLQVSPGTLNFPFATPLDTPSEIPLNSPLDPPLNSPLDIQKKDAQANVLPYRGGELQLSLSNKIIKGQADFIINDNNKINFAINIPNWKQDININKQRIKGKIKVQMQDLALLQNVMEINKARGIFAADIQFSGTMDEPRITGNASIDQGQLQVPRLGLHLNNIKLVASSDTHARKENSAESETNKNVVDNKKYLNEIKLVGEVNSGLGQCGINGVLKQTIDKKWLASFNVEGKDFTAVDIPEARVIVSPDLYLQVQNKRIDFVGTLNVPEADLQPKDMSSRVQVSDDEVLITKKIKQQKPKESTWDIYTTIRIALGDKVTFKGFGLDSDIGGSVVAIDEPKKLTLGYGRLDILNGKYATYGENLEVARGALIYSGNPIDNPGLDIRVIRHIGESLVGAQVRGTLQNAQLTLFSDPPKEQTDIISHLILGVPLTEASGDDGSKLVLVASALKFRQSNKVVKELQSKFGLQEFQIDPGDTPKEAALVLGKYLTPKLYISTNLGPSSSLNIRYKLGSKWILQSETGNEKGADLLYTFEH